VGVGKVCVVVDKILLGLGFKSPSSPIFNVCVSICLEKNIKGQELGLFQTMFTLLWQMK
jgi:hypothetical protein